MTGERALPAARRGAAPGGRAARRPRPRAPPEAAFDFAPLRGRAALSVEPLEDGLARVTLRVENATAVPADDADRAAALRHAPASRRTRCCGPPAGASSRRSTPASAPSSVNTFPVLASDEDDAVLGAAIMLPDHPQIAPESLGDLFDAHRDRGGAAAARAGALRRRASADRRAGPGGARDDRRGPSAPRPRTCCACTGACAWRTPMAQASGRSAGMPDEVPGEKRITVEGVLFRARRQGRAAAGARRRPLRPHADGRTATIERIFVDYDDRVHLGVTIDDDPGQDLLRETGPLPVFLRPPGGGRRHERAQTREADPGRRHRQRLDARRRLRRRGRQAPGGARAARPASPCSTSAPAGSTSPTR